MNKYLFCFFILLISIKVKSQDISYYEMKKLLEKNISDSEDFLILKKYKFYNQEKKNNCDDYDFAFNKKTNNDNADGFMTISICDESKSVTQSTASQDLIPKIKLDAKKDGLIFIKTDNFEGMMINIYSNNKYKLMVLSKKNSSGFSSYEISLEKK